MELDAENQPQASVLLENVSESTSAWHIDNPVIINETTRCAMIWTCALRDKHPTIQLVRAKEQVFILDSIKTDASSEWATLRLKINSDSPNDIMAPLDRYFIDKVTNNCSEWFGKQLDDETINHMYSSIIVKGSLNLKILKKSCNIWQADWEGCTRQRRAWNTLRKNDEIIPCISLNGLYFKPQKMGLSITCTDILFSRQKFSSFPFHLDIYLNETSHHQSPILPEVDGSDSDSVCEENYSDKDVSVMTLSLCNPKPSTANAHLNGPASDDSDPILTNNSFSKLISRTGS